MALPKIPAGKARLSTIKFIDSNYEQQGGSSEKEHYEKWEIEIGSGRSCHPQ